MKKILIAILSCLLLFSSVGFITVNAEKTYGNATQEEIDIFGLWNGNGWVKEGQLNYEIAGFDIIERSVKIGDYTLAKKQLFSYYKNRDSMKGMDFTVPDLDLADLTLRNIIVAGSTGSYVSFLDIETERKWYAFNVEGNCELGNQIAFTFIARGKQADNVVSFDSKEGENKPYLEITINGQTNIIYPSKDTYIRAGVYENANYGNQAVLEVNDSGFPYDDNTRRTTLIFDLSKYSGSVSGGKIMMFGGASERLCEVMVFKTGNVSWAENALVWKNETSNVFSWETLEEGTDWRQPASGSMDQYDRTIGALSHVYNLLSAYKETDKVDYAEKAVEMLLDYIKDLNGDVTFPDTLRLGNRQKNVPKFLNYLLKTPFLDEDSFFTIFYFMWQQNSLLGDPLLEYPKYVASHDDSTYITTSNWGIIQNNGLFTATYFAPEFKNYEQWSQLTQKRLLELVSKLLNDDGSYDEDTTMYPLASIRDYADVIHYATLNELPLLDEVKQKLCDWAMWIVDYSYPNGYSPNYGDGNTTSTRSTIETLARRLGDYQLLYFGTAGFEGEEIDHTSILYPESNVAIMRSDWDESALYMHVNTQSGTHNHTDVNGVIMYAYGQMLLPDTGTKSYDSNDPVSAWQMMSNESHSTFRVDNTESSRTAVFQNNVEIWQTGTMADVYRGYTEMYATAPHTRTVLMVKPGFYIVSDFVENLSTGKTRLYELNWQLLPNSNVVIDPITKKATTNFISGANLQIIPANHNLSAEIKVGYYTNGLGRTSNNSFVKYQLSGVTNFSASTVLYPTYEGQTRGVLASEIEIINNVNNLKNAMRIDFDSTMNGDVAYYYLSNESSTSLSTVQDGGVVFVFDGVLFYYQQSSIGVPVRFITSGGKTLTKEGQIIVESPTKMASFNGEYVGQTLSLSGDIVPCVDKTKAIKVYAPGVTAVTVNGQAVEFEREGDYVYACVSSEINEAEIINKAIIDLGNFNQLTAQSKSKVVEINQSVKLYVLKGFDIANITEYDNLLSAIARVDVQILCEDFLFHLSFLPKKDEINELNAKQVQGQLIVLNKTLQNILNESKDDSEFDEYVTLLNEYKTKADKYYSSYYNSIIDYTLLGENGSYNWWYYYLIGSTQDASKFGTLQEMVIHPEKYWAIDGNGWPRNAADHMCPNHTDVAIRKWVAPCDGTIKISVIVGAYVDMTAGNGAMAVISVNGLPYIVSGNSLVINPNAVFKQHIDPLNANNPIPTYYEYSDMIYLEKGDYIAIGVYGEGNSNYDRIYLNADINFMPNVKTYSPEIFDDCFAIVNRINELARTEQLTLEDRFEIQSILQDVAKIGRERISNIHILDEAVLKMEELVSQGYVVQTISKGEGQITVDKTVAKAGDIVNITITPKEGYEYKEGSLKINGALYDSLNFVMPSKVTTVSCEFEKIKYAIIYSQEDNSTIYVSHEKAEKGERVYFTVVTNYGYVIKDGQVFVNGNMVDSNYFEMPDGEVKITYEIIEIELGEKNTLLIWALIISCVILVIGVVVITFILLKKRRDRK